METVSVIIPVHNMKKYIGQCLDSVKKQTFQKLEIIVIDDASTDGSLKICEEYAKKDNRFKIIQNSICRGVSDARNAGLDICTGDYITFLDADDFFSEDYIDKLLYTIKDKNADIVTCGGWDTNEAGIPKETENNKEVIVITIDSHYRFDSKYAHTVARCALYKKSIIKDIRFDSTLYVGEDTYFYAQVLKRAKLICYMSERLYYYRIHTASITHRKFQEKQFTEADAWDKVENLYKDNKKILKSIKAVKTNVLCQMLKRAWSENEYKKQCRDYVKLIKKNLMYTAFSHLSIKNKISIFFFALMPDTYMKLYNNLK